MILTCPACSTRYFADDNTLGAKGRTVRCAACGHSWHARAEAFEKEDERPTFSSANFDTGEDEAPAEEANAAEDVTKPTEPTTPHAVFRAKQAERKRRTKLMVVGGAWGTVALVLVVGLILSFVFRHQVVEAWPKTASAYDLIGATVNPYGLEFEGVKMERQVVDGSPVLAINGAVRNATDDEQQARPIELALLDHRGRRTYAWTVEPEERALKPGEVAKFLTRIADPPVEAMQLEMTLLDRAPKSPAAAEPQAKGAQTSKGVEDHKADDHAEADETESPEPTDYAEVESAEPIEDVHVEDADHVKTEDHSEAKPKTVARKDESQKTERVLMLRRGDDKPAGNQDTYE